MQKIDPARCKPRTRKEWEENGGGVPRRVVSRMLQAGYVDSLHAADPAAAETLGSFTTEFPGQRVDYILTWGIEPARIRVRLDRARRSGEGTPATISPSGRRSIEGSPMYPCRVS